MRLLAFTLLAVAAVSGKEIKKICEPGTMTTEDCVACRCSADGTFRTCTLACEPETRLRREATEEDDRFGEIDHQNSGVFSNVPLPLRQRRQVSHNRPCVAGTQFKIYCNTCTCGADGFSVACTRMECDERVFNEDGSLKVIGELPHNEMVRQERQIRHKRSCEPGESFKLYCNTCWCGDDGVPESCTRMGCPKGMYNEDGSRRNVGEAPNNALLRQKRQAVSHNRPCKAGTQFKIYCNTCSCGSDGFSVACTRMMCPEGVYNEDGSLKNIQGDPKNALVRQKRQLSEGTTCEPGKSFKEYCNTCTCGPDGVTKMCTLMACDERVYNKDGSLKNLGEVPNNALLRQKRQAVSHNRPCKAGTQFKIYCNTCSCGSDGFSVACTRMMCPEGVYNEDGSLKNIQGDPKNALVRQKRQLSEGTTCEPGKSFKEYCNTCTCGPDGVTKMCTLMACDERVYNKDGSLKNLGEVPNNALLRQKRQDRHKRSCEPGTRIQMDCNTCLCGDNGVPTSCTRIGCIKGTIHADGTRRNVGETPNNALLRQKRQAVSHNRPCEAGTQFKIYCNTCSCGSDGFSVACTRMMCPEGVYNEDGSLKNIGGDPKNALVRQKRQLSEGTTCEPGKSFKEYCNTCTCGPDGVTKMCTLMACDERVYNKDGSLKNLGEVPNNALLRQKRQAVSHNRPCKAGTQFKIYCNTCSCGSDGFSVACTRMMCPEGVYNEDGSLKNIQGDPKNALVRQKRQLSEGTTCEPGKSFKEYCNTCTCGPDGVTKMCTLMACDERVYNKDGSLKNLGEVPNNALLRQKRQAVSHNRPCKAGTQFKIYCNTCSCGSDGFSVACTRMMCPEGVYNEDGSLKNIQGDPKNALVRQKRQLSEGTTCEPGKSFKEYCNTCTCGPDGVTKMCTLMACDERVYNKDGSLKNLGEVPNNALLRQKRQDRHKRSCEPGTRIQMDCNTCLCGDNGVPTSCTRIGCIKGTIHADGTRRNVGETPNNALLRQKRQAVSHNRPCEAGTQFKIYCNTCSCGSDGFSVACTRMMCPEGVYNEDGSLKNIGGDPKNALVRQKRQLSEGTTCEPGKSFKEYCNTCTCGPDGVTKMCTLMACDERVYNKDGSLKNLGEVPNNALLRQKRQAVSHNRPCKAGTQFKIYCNTCSCGSDGFSVACTRMMCPEGVYNEDGSLKKIGGHPDNALVRQKRQLSEGTTCEPGKSFKEYCNTCTCALDGVSLACTLMGCDETVYNKDGSLKNVGTLPSNALLRQKRQLSEGTTCEPGKSFKDYCNTCTCGLDGVTMMCTLMACDERVYNKDGTLKNVGEVPNNTLLRQTRQAVSHNRPCEAGTQFKIYCNTCSCGSDGFSVACTRKMCPEGVYNEDGSLKNVGEVPNNALLRQTRQAVSHNRPCEAGTQFKIYCNTCSCGSDGFSVACTRKMCPEGVYNEDGSLKNVGEVPNNALLRQTRQAVSHNRPCEAGTQFKIYCNTCSCGSDGFSVACTRKMCPEGVYNEDGSLKNVGEVPNNALLRQTRQAVSHNRPCEAGSQFKIYCNTCSCGSDGFSVACTRKMCPEGVYNEDGSLKNVGEVPNNALLRQKRQLSEGTTCEPGKSFKDYCNTCTCGLDGVTKMCTLMACDERVYNKDGSLKNLGEVPTKTTAQ